GRLLPSKRAQGWIRRAADCALRSAGKDLAMRRDLLWTSACALSFVGSVGIAAGQQPSPPADAQQRSQQENAQQTPSGKMGKEEPSSHAPNAQPQQNAAFVNGALAVPGAPANTDTVPAKYSQKN